MDESTSHEIVLPQFSHSHPWSRRGQKFNPHFARIYGAIIGSANSLGRAFGGIIATKAAMITISAHNTFVEEADNNRPINVGTR